LGWKNYIDSILTPEEMAVKYFFKKIVARDFQVCAKIKVKIAF